MFRHVHTVALSKHFYLFSFYIKYKGVADILY